LLGKIHQKAAVPCLLPVLEAFILNKLTTVDFYLKLKSKAKIATPVLRRQDNWVSEQEDDEVEVFENLLLKFKNKTQKLPFFLISLLFQTNSLPEIAHSSTAHKTSSSLSWRVWML
jgi:hypothetical protein